MTPRIQEPPADRRVYGANRLRLNLLIATLLVVGAVVSGAPGLASAKLRVPARSAVPPQFPRVVPERLVTRLLDAAAVRPTRAQLHREYGPRCCLADEPLDACTSEDPYADGLGWTRAPTDDEVDVCWADAGDGGGPDLQAYVGPGYQPGLPVRSGANWGEAAPDVRRRAIREMLRVFAERQPARQLGAVVYAIGFTESGFNPTAVHYRTSACGVHQFLPTTWPMHAREAAKLDPAACKDPRESTFAALAFHQYLFETYVRPVVEAMPEWSTMSEWDRLTTVFLKLYALHNYGEYDPRWQEDDTPVQRIALAHLGTLKAVWDAINAPAATPARPARAAAKATRTSRAPKKPATGPHLIAPTRAIPRKQTATR